MSRFSVRPCRSHVFDECIGGPSDLCFFCGSVIAEHLPGPSHRRRHTGRVLCSARCASGAFVQCVLLGEHKFDCSAGRAIGQPKPLEVILRPASDDGLATPDVSPLLQQSLGASVNRLVLLRVPAASSPLLWESSYQCGEDDGADEFGFVTASAPPALSLLLPEVDSQAGSLQQQLASLQAVCGSSTAVAPLKQVFDFGDDVIDDSWPETVTVQCF